MPRRTAAAASVWETRMKMDEVKGGVKVFSEGGDDADEEGMRVYSRLRRNQSDGAGGGSGSGSGATAAAKKRRNWKASEPVTAIGELRKSRSDAAAVTGVVAKRAVSRVTTPEKKLTAACAEVKEVVVVEVPLQQSKDFEEDEEAEEDEEEWEEELEEEDEKEVLDQDHMAIDDDETLQAKTPLHQGKNLLAL